MKSFIKAILVSYVKRLQFRRAVQEAFLKNYKCIPIKESKRIPRKFVYEQIEETLRLPPNNFHRHYFKECLVELGVVPTSSKGMRYFRGIKNI